MARRGRALTNGTDEDAARAAEAEDTGEFDDDAAAADEEEEEEERLALRGEPPRERFNAPLAVTEGTASVTRDASDADEASNNDDAEIAAAAALLRVVRAAQQE